MKTTENEEMQQAPGQNSKETPTMYSRIGVPDVLVTARPRRLALVTVLQRATTQRWLRTLCDTHPTEKEEQCSGRYSDPHNCFDLWRKDRAYDCVNYTACLDAASSLDIYQKLAHDRWSCTSACSCYQPDPTCLNEEADTADYWVGGRRDNE